MNYPGNETLAEEIRQRIVNTFLQTLDLVDKGDIREAQLGCDFVLRLDPMFKPARTLDGRLRTSEGQVDVDDLRSSVTTGAAPEPSEPSEPAEPAAHADNGTRSDEPFEMPGGDDEPGTLDAALDLSSLDSAEAEEAPAGQPPMAPGDAETPAAPATAGEPVAALDSESERRVQDLLSEGQTAFESSEYQSAIDAWSRIFLIDIDHPEANRRIDLARKLKAEVERKLEETFHDAVSKVEEGRLDKAREGFAAVLEIVPGHVAAQEYLARLDAPDFSAPDPVAPQPPSRAQPAPPAPRAPTEATDAGSEGLTDEAPEPLETEIFTPPPPREEAPSSGIGRVGRVSKPVRASNQTFKIAGVGALVLIAVVGWLLFKNWDVFFPNATDEAPAVQLDPITRAKRTYTDAGAAIAIAQLRRLSPGHQQYAEAQALVAQWETALDASNPDQNEPEPEALAARDRWVNEASTAFAARQHLLAKEYLERAASQSPLDDEAAEMLEQTETELAPLRAEIALFRDGDWDVALRNLWRMREGGANTPDVRRLMIDSYFNLGVRDLQRNNTEAAIESFQEARELAGDDDELVRLIKFAHAYEGRHDDLLYRIFVKYLPFR